MQHCAKSVEALTIVMNKIFANTEVSGIRFCIDVVEESIVVLIPTIYRDGKIPSRSKWWIVMASDDRKVTAHPLPPGQFLDVVSTISYREYLFASQRIRRLASS